jgi:hypothetical protein
MSCSVQDGYTCQSHSHCRFKPALSLIVTACHMYMNKYSMSVSTLAYVSFNGSISFTPHVVSLLP